MFSNNGEGKMTFEKDNHEVTTEAAKKTKTTKAATEMVTLKTICAEMKIDPTEARVKLRAAGKKLRHAQGQPWTWSKGSPVIKEVKAILEGEKS
jgi:hypothetical protein